jgi:hypothetical protein
MKTVLNLIDWREVAAIVGHGIVTLAVLTYWTGWGVGRAVHDAAAWLAHHWPTRPAVAAPQQRTAPAPRVTVDLAPQPDALTARIQALRTQGWSQQRIADAVGVSRATVRRRLADAVLM